jgi:DNA (cytosine-5)-methyltransferase 1
MEMSAYYNEIDPYAAEWLRNLIKAGHIAPGFVDERSIEDVTPSELMEYTQCHFFAGIGVWSHALRSAGWPDSRPVWTGSCPCQPFSSAGKGDGFADERHLWPAFNHLIAECRPSIILGEQVAAKAVEPWIDLVHADLEALGYTFGATPFPSAGIGAPHIRDRMYWVADSAVRGRQQLPNVKPTSLFDSKTFAGEQVQQSGTNGASLGGLADSSHSGRIERELRDQDSAECAAHSGRQDQGVRESGIAGNGIIGGLDNNNNKGLEGHRGGHQAESGRDGEIRPVAETGESGGLADTSINGHPTAARSGDIRRVEQLPGWSDREDKCLKSTTERSAELGRLERSQAGPTNGFWGAADWLLCRDGKWRPVEPGTFPLAYGAASRVGRLRAYGNAINAKAAQAFIECVI